MLFFIFLAVVITQRIIELVIAKRNERWLKKRGAIEFGKAHYRIIVFIHALFFICLLFEVIYFKKELSFFWPLLLVLFLITQAGRIWALTSLGRYWNTKIIVLPGSEVVKKGPYQFMKHPNYVIVSLELLIVPLLFDAYITALLFSMLNALILSIRIPAEEKALKDLTEYDRRFAATNRFIPKNVNKV
ncbi:hypothetical protein CVD25_11795 [Bacillus canaveralius]|uniref:Isoprenylcysteine carboxyl methyltransferase n=1 Tax=Bacillus canaveralius TaxID=1403243 RepID=A0A2N5GFV1_9BACI|nr:MULTISPECIES: isoprenylcysteine carboxylmethyltransferase family protein [Bacillus]PLR79605.1 hypothetical protein CU635_22185 [Bacillus canaveralius]PLR82714.1 hypothetical protein CVD23_16070 [Bacillus sp. V33-4]PLR96466.1 hypothetical protein CVD25_11795 [Bacillus canaveralius]RSK53749.1 hypothetical protein EJA13_07470 [Bacillus canaveralius]